MIEEPQQFSAIEGILNRWGLPIAMMVVGGYLLWRVARWFAPLAAQLVTGHLKFMDTIDSRTQALLSKTDTTNALLTDIKRDLERRP